MDIDRRKRYLIFIALVLFLLVLFFRVRPLFFTLLPDDDEVALKRATLMKYHKVLEKKTFLEKYMKGLSRDLERAESYLLSGKTPSLAAVEVQNILTSIASKNDADISRVQVLKPVEAEEKGYVLIPIRFSVNATVRQLKEILFNIGSARKFLILKRVSISTMWRRKSRMVRSDMTLYGVMKKK